MSKAFDCIPHDLLLAKNRAYGFSMDALIFIYSNIKSLLKILVSGVPQGSILGPILFNLFINDLFLFTKKANFANFADDNTIYATCKDITGLVEILKSGLEEAINWFETNHIYSNPDKFQAIAVHHNKNINENYTIKVNNIEIESQNSVKLLGIEIDNKLLFDKHIASLSKKAAKRLHAICRIQNQMGKKETQMGKKEEEILINSFIYSNFHYCPFVWHFYSKNRCEKLRKFRRDAC